MGRRQIRIRPEERGGRATILIKSALRAVAPRRTLGAASRQSHQMSNRTLGPCDTRWRNEFGVGEEGGGLQSDRERFNHDPVGVARVAANATPERWSRCFTTHPSVSISIWNMLHFALDCRCASRVPRWQLERFAGPSQTWRPREGCSFVRCENEIWFFFSFRPNPSAREDEVSGSLIMLFVVVFKWGKNWTRSFLNNYIELIQRLVTSHFRALEAWLRCFCYAKMLKIQSLCFLHSYVLQNNIVFHKKNVWSWHKRQIMWNA